MPDVSRITGNQKLDWTEYKTIRQFQAIGDILDDLRTYGHIEGKDESEKDFSSSTRNSHIWLTEDPDP